MVTAAVSGARTEGQNVNSLLTIPERAELARCEAIIAAGIKTFYEVGSALLSIRDGRLYREQYRTWEQYVNARWEFTRQRAQQFMAAVAVVENVQTIAPVTNEAQARELAKHAPELQKAVACIVIASAPDGKLTSGRIKRAAETLAEAVRTGAVDTGSGRSTPLTAALTIAEDEAVKRQQVHIQERIERKAGGGARYETVVEFQKATVAGTVVNGFVTLKLPGVSLERGDEVFVTIKKRVSE